MLLLLFSNQPSPPSPGYVNASVVIGNIWPPLNANSEADAVFWTLAEMITWFNDAARKLSGCAGVFVVRNTSLSSVTAQASYALPDSHQATLQADLDGQVLRPRNVQEVESLDADWPNTQGPPVAFLLDVNGAKTIALYPKADVGSNAKTIGLIMRSLPPAITSVAGFLTVPAILADYFTFYLLEEARSKETKAQMPEISAWLRQLTGMYEQTIQGLLGGA